jgi:uncharacterized protein YbaR (Trm112 family)
VEKRIVTIRKLLHMQVCPMCEQEIVLSSITKVNNPEDFLKAAQRRDDASDHSK